MQRGGQNGRPSKIYYVVHATFELWPLPCNDNYLNSVLLNLMHNSLTIARLTADSIPGPKHQSTGFVRLLMHTNIPGILYP